MDTFNYANKNNFLQWFLLIFSGLLVIFFLFTFFRVKENGDFLYPVLVPVFAFAIICFMTINKMFLSKIYIAEKYIEYKSPFTKVKINKEDIKGIDLLKKPRKRAPIYLTLNDKPEINIGNYFFIIRKTYYKPDSAYFLAFNPVEENYITAEYRDSFFEKLKEYKYL